MFTKEELEYMQETLQYLERFNRDVSVARIAVLDKVALLLSQLTQDAFVELNSAYEAHTAKEQLIEHSELSNSEEHILVYAP